MSEETLESNSGLGSTGTPNPATSQTGNDSSTSKFDASKLPEQIESYVSKAIEKALQSTKDKRISGIEKTLSDLTPVMEKVKTILTPQQLAEFNQIQKDEEFEQLKRVVYGQAKTSIAGAGNSQNAAVSDTHAGIVKDYGLDANDPEVVANVLSQTDPKDAEIAAARLRNRRQTQPPPSPTAASGVIDTPPPPPAGVEELTKNYKNEMRTKLGAANKQARDDIKAKYSKLGVNIYDIDFT